MTIEELEQLLNNTTSQIEKFKQEVNSNFQTATNRFNAVETAHDGLVKAVNILESDVRAIGGKKLENSPKGGLNKENQSKYAFSLFGL